jgi:excisionase family DNA binding protein
MSQTLDFRDPEWVAEQLNVDKNAVYRYLNDGVLPGMQLGRKWLISESTLAEFLKAEERRQTAERRLASTEDPGEGFTPRARAALAGAQDEALRRNHTWIGTEHVLLALVADPDNRAVELLAAMDVQQPAVVAAVEFVIGKYTASAATAGSIGLTPRAKKALELAVAEANNLNHGQVGCEHLLLGLIAEGDGIAAAVLKSLNVTLEAARESWLRSTTKSRYATPLHGLHFPPRRSDRRHPGGAILGGGTARRSPAWCICREMRTLLPLVLMQHPGMGSKDDYFVGDVARQWARRGWICGGIDAPLHGDREDHDPMALFRDRERYPEIAAQFAEEVSLTIDALAEELPVDTERLGYIGYSLGSMLGVPAVARDGRFRVASFCLVGEGGLVGPATGETSVVARLERVAVRIVEGQ